MRSRESRAVPEQLAANKAHIQDPQRAWGRSSLPPDKTVGAAKNRARPTYLHYAGGVLAGRFICRGARLGGPAPREERDIALVQPVTLPGLCGAAAQGAAASLFWGLRRAGLLVGGADWRGKASVGELGVGVEMAAARTGAAQLQCPLPKRVPAAAAPLPLPVVKRVSLRRSPESMRFAAGPAGASGAAPASAAACAQSTAGLAGLASSPKQGPGSGAACTAAGPPTAAFAAASSALSRAASSSALRSWASSSSFTPSLLACALLRQDLRLQGLQEEEKGRASEARSKVGDMARRAMLAGEAGQLGECHKWAGNHNACLRRSLWRRLRPILHIPPKTPGHPKTPEELC